LDGSAIRRPSAFITQVIGEFNPGPDQLLNQAIVTAEFTRFA